MSADQNLDQVTDFYQTHPISEAQILEKLAARGIATDALNEDILQEHDQDHFGGTGANDILAERIGLTADTELLDVCCGLGGPSRYLAHNYGCHVTGIDLTESRVLGARHLSALCGLEEKLTFLSGNALDMPFTDSGFDAAVSQEAFCHIPHKSQLLTEIARVLRSGGRLAFTDILAANDTPKSTLARLENEMAYRDLATAEMYCQLLQEAGFKVVEVDDLGAEWREILVARLAMYRSLKDQTVARFGSDHYAVWDSAYGFFVSRYDTGELSGGRFIAQRI